MDKVIEKFQERMTVLKRNPVRFEDPRFTRYFGGICICYFDTKLKRYVVERIATPVECGEGKKPKEASGRDSKSD